ncbi:NF-kappa-B essential modulator [Triticum aestivum]|uniref:NF-kappa-B essential modulator n=1 Tax=Triticum aestivum TaxID=4565 RepID=UPI001D012191|nr:NF-kappa-B essential modulator-like [Triticum aestivum]
MSVRPSSLTADPPYLFATHHVPEDQVGAAKEAIRQAGIMMEQVKAIREASQAAYDASSALQSNVQKSCELVARCAELENKQIQLDLDLKLIQENFQKAKDEAKDKMKEALKKKDRDLAEAQKAALDKTKLAEEKLASVGKLEEENANLKAAPDAANKEVSRLKNDKIALSDKASEPVGKRNDLEAYLGGLAKKLFTMLEGNLSYPTDLLSSTHGRTGGLSLNVYRILPKLRGGDQSSGDRLGSHQLPCEG